jgi:hypothetical protein
MILLRQSSARLIPRLSAALPRPHARAAGALHLPTQFYHRDNAPQSRARAHKPRPLNPQEAVEKRTSRQVRVGQQQRFRRRLLALLVGLREHLAASLASEADDLRMTGNARHHQCDVHLIAAFRARRGFDCVRHPWERPNIAAVPLSWCRPVLFEVGSRFLVGTWRS